jgi:heme exporter protein D
MPMQQFFAMGGYAVYLWPAYAIAAVVMIGLLVQTLASLRARERELASLGEKADR